MYFLLKSGIFWNSLLQKIPGKCYCLPSSVSGLAFQLESNFAVCLDLEWIKSSEKTLSRPAIIRLSNQNKYPFHTRFFNLDILFSAYSYFLLIFFSQIESAVLYVGRYQRGLRRKKLI